MKTNLTNWLCGLCAILLIAVLVIQLKQQSQLDALQQRQVKENVAEIKNAVQQQTAVIHRALGKVISVELPDSLIKKLGALETRVTDKKSWPKDAVETDAMLTELRDLVRQIPPWAEEDLLPRLNALRWGISGIVLIVRSQTVTNEVLADFLDSVDTALEAKPTGASELVASQLSTIQGKAKAQSDSFRRDNAIADAERLIKDGGTATEFFEVQERLSEWAASPEFKERVGRLQHDVKARALLDDTVKFTASVDKSLSRVRSEPSLVVRQISLGQLLDSVVSQRQMLAENQDAPESLDRKLAELSAQIDKVIQAEAKDQIAEQEKKLRNYQGWALGQIRKFNDDMLIAEKADKGMFINSADYTRIKNNMVNYLVPISVGLLDPAVARLYNEAFERGWKQLDGKDQKYLQTEVAKKEAVVEKRKP
ncbi:MAG: hypothetical protein SFY92_10600 [Verrucomicrobiae bacterium]|nr:hypothetical protein [Verrucomicrobiae bacterium]